MKCFFKMFAFLTFGMSAFALDKITCDTEADIAALNPGQWGQVPITAPHNTLFDVRPAGSNPRVMDPWCGGAFDTKRERLTIWGGGHGDYSGNEIYVFSTTGTLSWTRVNSPSVPDTNSSQEALGVYADGEPRSIHTYDALEYVPDPVDRFCTMESAGTYPSGQSSLPAPFCYNFNAANTSSEWQRMGSSDRAGASYGAITGRDSSGFVWVHNSGGNAHLSRWNVATDTWTHYPLFQGGNWFPGSMTGAVGMNKFMAIGGGKVYVWDLTNPSAPVQEITTAGDKEIIDISCPGLEFDPKTNLFVAWHGGSHIYTIDLSKTAPRWICHTPPTGPSANPTCAQANGTFGRFRIVPSRNVFVAVNEVNESVYFYKLSNDITGAIPSSGVDTLAPIIHFNYASVESPGVEISWNTNEFADTQVEYGTTTALGQSYRNSVPSINHRPRLTGLLAGGITYYYRIRARDAAGNESVTSINSFQTLSTTPAMYLTLTGTDVSETAGVAWLTVHTGYIGTQDVTITYQTGGGTAQAGSDYTSKSGSVILPAGKESVSFSIPILNDALLEPNETILVDLGVAPGSSASWTYPLGSYPAELTIHDDETSNVNLLVAGAPFTAPATVQFTVQTQTLTGISKVEYFNGGASIGLGNLSGTGYPFSWSGVYAGSYDITARVTHSDGVTASFPITVAVSGNPPPSNQIPAKPKGLKVR